MLYWLDALIDFHGGPFSSVVGRLRKLGLRTASSVHLPDVSPAGRPLGHPYISLAYEHAFDVFAPCSEQLGDWLHAMGVPEEKILPVPNAPGFRIAPQTLEDCLRARASRDDKAPLRVLFLGRLDPQKGLDRLAQVVERSAGLNLEWRVIGKAVLSPQGGRALPEVLAPLLEPPLTTPEALAAAYAQADVLVLLSGYEGLPLTILEAMRQGVVVLATDVGAVAEVVRHGQNGLLLPLEAAVSACLEGLAQLSSDRQMLRRLSQRAALDMEGREWSSAAAALIGRLTAPR
ncbi:glycosyltransferase family 4 protein [Falsigemmobacter intermedius]|uniref:glycosyltransferase family 4 protein n=1 Tax=Falsigemmobacter intermedius TaxID=1553448 RepID=UPI003F021E25